MTERPSAGRERTGTDDEMQTGRRADSTALSRGGLLRSAVTGIVTGAAAYVAFRRMRDSGAALDRAGEIGDRAVPRAVRETVDDVVPADVSDLPIGTGGEESGDEADRGPEAVAGVDRSEADISELAQKGVQEEPAHPGEMTVDEEIVDDLIEERDAEDSDEEA